MGGWSHGQTVISSQMKKTSKFVDSRFALMPHFSNYGFTLIKSFLIQERIESDDGRTAQSSFHYAKHREVGAGDQVDC